MTEPTVAILAACLWALVANIVALIPFGDRHRRAAVVLIAAFVPIALWVFVAAGRWWGLAVLAGGVSVLRYPLRWLGRGALRRLRKLRSKTADTKGGNT